MKSPRRYPAVVSYRKECPPKAGNSCRDYSPHSLPRNSSRWVQRLLTRRHLYVGRKGFRTYESEGLESSQNDLVDSLAREWSERPGPARDNKQMRKNRPITKISRENL
jgi:hypothetical protein